jgi:two-component system sensor histidine kinase UhpB
LKLRTHVNLIVASLSAAFFLVVTWLQFDVARRSVNEEMTGANIVAARLLEGVVDVYQDIDEPRFLKFLQKLGRLRAHEIALEAADGTQIYRSPPSPYKVGREAPQWFSAMLTPETPDRVFTMADGAQLRLRADASRAILDGWDHLTQLMAYGAIAFAILNALVFWLAGRAVAPWPVIANGLSRIERGDLAYRLPDLGGHEASAIAAAFNRMAPAIQEKLNSERKARDAEERLQERRELDRLVEQRLDEERRLIARELHDEFAQSVTAIRSLAVVIATHEDVKSASASAAQLISTEAARLYDAMHGLIPRLAPLSLDTIGLAETLEGFIREWQHRHPDIAFTLRHEITTPPGASVSLAIYRIIQESVINAVRHAQPSKIAVEVDCTTRLLVRVTDDGIGLPADWSRPGHFGLRGLQERVTQLGGELQLLNLQPHGTAVVADIPFGAAA